MFSLQFGDIPPPYCGPRCIFKTLRDLSICSSTFNTIVRHTVSQCRDMRIGEMCSDFMVFEMVESRLSISFDVIVKDS